MAIIICGYCFIPKDESQYRRQWRESKTHQKDCKPLCKSCYNRQQNIQHMHNKDIECEARQDMGRIMVILNSTMPFIAVEERIQMRNWIIRKKWTIEAILGLHKLPKPILYAKIAKMITKQEEI
jgi:hypothetical protein